MAEFLSDKWPRLPTAPRFVGAGRSAVMATARATARKVQPILAKSDAGQRRHDTADGSCVVAGQRRHRVAGGATLAAIDAVTGAGEFRRPAGPRLAQGDLPDTLLLIVYQMLRLTRAPAHTSAPAITTPRFANFGHVLTNPC